MPVQADFTFDKAGGDNTVILSGDWTARGLFDAGVRLADALKGTDGASLDLSQVNRCDTAGAYAIIRAADGRQSAGKIKARKQILRLFELVGSAVQVEPEIVPRQKGFHALLERIGRGMFGLGDDAYSTMVFLGHLLIALGRCIVKPSRIRWAPIMSLAERAGLDAMPIVATTTFFIGAVVALLGGQYARLVRSPGLFRRTGRRLGAARVQHPYHRDPAGRPLGVQLRGRRSAR